MNKILYKHDKKVQLTNQKTRNISKNTEQILHLSEIIHPNYGEVDQQPTWLMTFAVYQ